MHPVKFNYRNPPRRGVALLPRDGVLAMALRLIMRGEFDAVMASLLFLHWEGCGRIALARQQYLESSGLMYMSRMALFSCYTSVTTTPLSYPYT